MPTCGLMLILGAIFGIISSIVVYTYDWTRLIKENQEIKELNAELVEMVRMERAINELLGHHYRKKENK